MKKFIIVIVFVFLITILISFNYVLWDREKQLASFQDISDSKSLTIETLSEKMNNLDKLNKELTTRVENLTNDNTTLRESLLSRNDENKELKREIISKNELITALKNTIDITPMDTVIKKWTESVDSKNYQLARSFISESSKDQTINDDVKFKELYQSEIKSIRLKTSNLYTELTDDEHLGIVQIKVVFEVDKPDVTKDNEEKVSNSIFKNGENIKYITMELNSYTNEWLIQEINDNP